MNVIDAVIQGIIQGLTEFLPVSSSGHLALVQYFTGNGGQTGAFFSVLLHAGTLIAVVFAFWKTIARLLVEGFYMLGALITFKFNPKHMTDYQRMICLLIVATIPLFGFVFFKDFFQSLATDKSLLAEGVCFLITSMLLFISDRCPNGKKGPASMKNKDALAMGIAQGVALLPGVSRSGSTISLGIIAGLKRPYAVEFSFIMGIPAVLGAIVLEMGEVMATPIEISSGVIIAGLLSSVIFGIIAIKLVNMLVSKHKFKYFAYYTLVLGVGIIMLSVYEIFSKNSFWAIFA